MKADESKLREVLDKQGKSMDIIGKTFGYKGIGGIVYIVTVHSFVQKGEHYDADSYTGKQILIYPNGKTITRDWSRDSKYFDEGVESGKYKLIG